VGTRVCNFLKPATLSTEKALTLPVDMNW
jgi:hypothetical protein